MSFDNKNYPKRKDWRKPYYKSGRFDKGGRPNGGCPYCLRNRMHSSRVRQLKSLYELIEYQRRINELNEEIKREPLEFTHSAEEIRNLNRRRDVLNCKPEDIIYNNWETELNLDFPIE